MNGRGNNWGLIIWTSIAIVCSAVPKKEVLEGLLGPYACHAGESYGNFLSNVSAATVVIKSIRYIDSGLLNRYSKITTTSETT